MPRRNGRKELRRCQGQRRHTGPKPRYVIHTSRGQVRLNRCPRSRRGPIPNKPRHELNPTLFLLDDLDTVFPLEPVANPHLNDVVLPRACRPRG